MSVVIAFEEAGPWRKRLTIEVPAPAVEAETGRVVKDIGRRVRLPGFRQGKVPASMIQRRFSDEVERRVTERLIPRYWHQAEAEKSIDALTQPQVEDVKFEPGESMTFVAVVETRPEIVLRNVEDFTLPAGEVEPTDDDLAQALLDLRRQHAPWRSVERPAATGDVVLGQVFEDAGEDARDPQPLRIEIGGDGADEELSLALTGLAAGRSVPFRRRAGEQEAAKDYRIEVAEVRERQLPELDDAFAGKLGVADVAALRQAVSERLRQAKESRLRARREQALLEQLRARHPLELPQGVVDQEVDRLLHDQAHRLSAQGVDLERVPIDWEAMASQIRPEAQKRVHDRLLLDAVAKAREIRLDEQEFERVLAGIAREQKKSSLAVRQELDAAGRLASLRAQMLERQTLLHLLGAAGEEAAAESAMADPSDKSDES
jgi:trigger factor